MGLQGVQWSRRHGGVACDLARPPPPPPAERRSTLCASPAQPVLTPTARPARRPLRRTERPPHQASQAGHQDPPARPRPAAATVGTGGGGGGRRRRSGAEPKRAARPIMSTLLEQTRGAWCSGPAMGRAGRRAAAACGGGGLGMLVGIVGPSRRVWPMEPCTGALCDVSGEARGRQASDSMSALRTRPRGWAVLPGGLGARPVPQGGWGPLPPWPAQTTNFTLPSLSQPPTRT